MQIRIGLMGDYNQTVPAHQAIPLALNLAAQRLGVIVTFDWVPTETILDISCLTKYDGIWCVPASPYRNMKGALLAIQYAREGNVPFLGTCGGFQHAIIEYARNVMGWKNAEHAETAPDGERLVISRLACSLVEVQKPIFLIQGTKIATAYGTTQIMEGYHCNYGLNPVFERILTAADSNTLRISARDDSNEVRALELSNHSFFAATLFQPERLALQGQLPPLVLAFVQEINIKNAMLNKVTIKAQLVGE